MFSLSMLFLRNRRGSMITVIPILVIFGVMAMLVITSLQNNLKIVGILSNSRNIQLIGYDISNRIVGQLKAPESTLDSSFANYFKLAKNFADPKEQLMTISTQKPKAISGILLDTEAAILSQIDINLQTITSTDDLQNLSRQIRLTITLASSNNSHYKSDQVINLHIPSPANYTLILTKPDSKDLFNLGVQTKAFVFGDSFYAGTGSTVPLDIGAMTAKVFWTSPNLYFDGRFYTRSSSILASDLNLTPLMVSSVFKYGISTSHMATDPLPFDSLCPGCWANDIDYSKLYSDSANPPASSPIPDGNLIGASTGFSASEPYNFSGLAHLAKIPAAGVLTALNETCAASLNNLGVMEPMTILRAGQDFQIDFVASKAGDTLLPRYAFCGLIRAKNLTINLQPGLPNILIGKLIVESLTITGAGNLYIIDPDQAYEVPKVIVDSGAIDFNMLRQQIAGLQSYLGSAFYVPFSKRPLPAPFLLVNPAQTFLTGCGGGRCDCEGSTTMLCWPPSIPARVNSNSILIPSQIDNLSFSTKIVL